jgi:hypothetical protein
VKNRLRVPLLIALALGLTVGFASSAAATPTKTTLCSGCHAPGAAVTVSASLVSASAATSVYAITANNPYGSNAWAVFQGSTKVAGAAGSGSNVTLTNGVTYTVFGVSSDGNTTLRATTSVTPATPDLTAPTTTSDAVATYLNSATIHLSAADNAGGSGVAHTYYILDGGTQTEGTAVNTSVVGAHTLEFWSVDVATNAETPHKSVNFEVTAPLPDVTAPITTSDAVATYQHSATIHLSAADNVGGSGVAHTYYILDGGTQTEGTTINTSVVGAHTLEFWSEDASGNTEAPHGTTSFEVTPDLTAPTTTSNALATYIAAAAIRLTASDLGGSGVAHTYYILDGGIQTEGTTVNTSALGAHTLLFWSEDASGNVEATRSANFAVNAAPAAVKTYTYVYKFKLKKKVYKKLKAVLKSRVNGKTYTVSVSKKGTAIFKRIPRGSYRLYTSGNKRFKFKARTVWIGYKK